MKMAANGGSVAASGIITAWRNGMGISVSAKWRGKIGISKLAAAGVIRRRASKAASIERRHGYPSRNAAAIKSSIMAYRKNNECEAISMWHRQTKAYRRNSGNIELGKRKLRRATSVAAAA